MGVDANVLWWSKEEDQAQEAKKVSFDPFTIFLLHVHSLSVEFRRCIPLLVTYIMACRHAYLVGIPPRFQIGGIKSHFF